MREPMREPMDIVTRISQRAAELRPAEQKVAQTVLGDIAEAASGSIQTLAERAGVSEASVTRFAKAMGCRDVRELKLKLAQAAAVGQRFLDGGADRPPSSADGILADISNVLEANRALVRPESFRNAAVALAAARMITVFGMGGGSTTMADEMRYRLARLGRPVTTYHDSMLQRMVAATLSRDTVVVALSVSGRVPELLESCRLAKRYGAKLIAITAPASSTKRRDASRISTRTVLAIFPPPRRVRLSDVYLQTLPCHFPLT